MELEVSVGSAAGMGHPRCRQVAATGSTIRNIVAEPHIAIRRPRTGLALRRAATRCLIAKTRLGNKSVVRAATWQATEMGPEPATEAELEQATGAEPEGTIEPAAAMGLGAATDLAVGEIVSAVVTFHAAEEGTGMLSEAAPVAMTDPVREAAAAAARRVYEAAGEASAVAVEAVVAAVAVADVADKHPNLFKEQTDRSWQ